MRGKWPGSSTSWANIGVLGLWSLALAYGIALLERFAAGDPFRVLGVTQVMVLIAVTVGLVVGMRIRRHYTH